MRYKKRFIKKITEDLIKNPQFTQSKLEVDVLKEIRKYTDKTIIPNYKLQLGKDKEIEIDIYFPDEKVGIEVNGNYWHSEGPLVEENRFTKKNLVFCRTRHYEKYKACKEEGITLLQFYEDELKFKTNQVLGIILHKINEGGCLQGGARTLKVIKINEKLANAFHNKYSIYGKINCKNEHLALIDPKTETIYAVMSFKDTSKGNFNKGVEFEIVRYTIGSNIPGGTGKLIKTFLRERKLIKCSTLKVYTDNRTSYGKVFKKLGFKQVKKVNPSFFCIDTKNSLLRYNKKASSNKELFKDGYYRLWDAGHVQWEFKN